MLTHYLEIEIQVNTPAPSVPKRAGDLMNTAANSGFGGWVLVAAVYNLDKGSY